MLSKTQPKTDRAVSYLYKPDFGGYPRNFGRFLISVQGVKIRVL